MAMRCTSITKKSGRNGEQVFFNFTNSSVNLTVELTGTPWEAVYDEPTMTPMVMLAIEAGVFDGEIEEATTEGEEEMFMQTAKRLALSNTN